MEQKLTPMEKLEAMANVLDKLADLPGGRVKCNLICVANELLNGIHGDFLVYEEKLKDATAPSGAPQQPEEPESVIDLDEYHPETMSTD